jgi:outer membrane protein TolC
MTRTWRILTAFVFVVMLGGLSVSAQQAAPPAPQQLTVTQTPAPQGPTTQGPTTPQTPAAAPQTPITIARYTVGQARPPVPEGSELVELTLEQAYALALEKNLDLKVARMQPVITDYTKQQLISAYRPTVSGSYTYNNSLTPSNNSLEGVLNLTNISQSSSANMNQSLRWYGAPSFSVGFSNSRTSTNNVTTRLNPSYNSGLNFSGNFNLTNQFRIDSNRNAWRTFPITREIADITLLNSIESTRASVRNAYWSLRSAIEQIEISRVALEMAQKSWSDSLIKVEIGTAASIDTVTFETQVAQAEQSYLSSQISWTTAELNFKRLIVAGTDDPLYHKTINPTDKPELSIQNVDIQAAVTRTLGQGTNLLIARKNLDIRRMNLEVTKANLLPTLTVNGGYRASGQAGTQHLSNGEVIPGGYWDALGILGGFSNPTWNFGFNFSYPIGQLNQKAAYATGQIGVDQAVAQLKAQELNVSTAVINAGLNVDNSYKLYLAAVKSREAAEKNADASQVRFDNGLLTNIEVVATQNTLTSARLSELTRLISYINAVAEFERIQKIGG